MQAKIATTAQVQAHHVSLFVIVIILCKASENTTVLNIYAICDQRRRNFLCLPYKLYIYTLSLLMCYIDAIYTYVCINLFMIQKLL